MMTSQHDIQQTEEYLSGSMDHPNSLVFEARILTDPVFKRNVELQRRIFSLIRIYGRKKAKREVEVVHQKLFHDPAKIVFQRTIHQLFHTK